MGGASTHLLLVFCCFVAFFAVSITPIACTTRHTRRCNEHQIQHDTRMEILALPCNPPLRIPWIPRFHRGTFFGARVCDLGAQSHPKPYNR